MTFYFQLGIGTSLLITVVVMAVLVIIVITMYMNHKRGTSKSLTPMILFLIRLTARY